MLGISPSTVDNHISSVMHIYNLPNRTALVRQFANPWFDFSSIDHDSLIADKLRAPIGQDAAAEHAQDSSPDGTGETSCGALPFPTKIALQAAFLSALIVVLLHFAIRLLLHVDL